MNFRFSSALLAFALLATSVAFTACDDDDDEATTITIDSSQPQGDFTVSRSGDFVAENGTPTMGTASLGTDSDGTNFLQFSDDFTTQLATGTVTVYLSTSETFTPDPMNGNPDLELVGSIRDNGEQNFRLESAPASTFTHVILWCASANIPFGNAELN